MLTIAKYQLFLRMQQTTKALSSLPFTLCLLTCRPFDMEPLNLP